MWLLFPERTRNQKELLAQSNRLASVMSCISSRDNSMAAGG
jgi:hypothetical protein